MAVSALVRGLPVLLLDAALAVATVAGLVLLGTQALVFGSKAGQWVYGYVASPDGTIVAVAALGAPLVVAAYEAARRRVDAHPAMVVGAVLAGGFAVQLALRALFPHSMEAIVVSNVANSFYGAAERVTPLELLRDFDRVSGSLPLHAQANMPGKVLFYQAMRGLGATPQAIALAIVGLSSMVGLVLYAVCGRLFGERTVGLDAMALWMLVPSKLGFHPLLNVLSPLPALLAVWAVTRFLDRPAWPWPLAIGLLTYATVFFDPHALWLGVVFAPAIAAAGVSGRLAWGRIVGFLVACLAALAAVQAVFVWGFGFDVWTRLFGLVDKFSTVQIHRAYDVWVRANAKDVALAAGPAVTVAFAAAVALAVWTTGRGALAGTAVRTLLSPGPATTVMTLAVLGTLLWMGLDRGEVQRLWIFLLAPVQAAVAWCLASAPAHTRWLVLAGTFAYATLSVAMVGYCLP